MTTRDAVVARARELLGVRFRHQGRSARHGLDCLGLLMVVAEGCGIRFDELAPSALDRTDYGSRPDAALLEALLTQWLQPVAQVRPGDVLLLRVQGAPQHLALVTDYPQAGALGMIHAYAPARMVVEHRYDKAWQATTHGAFSIPQLTDGSEK